MPFRTFDLDAAADYLHLAPAELEQLVKTTDIPHQNRGGRLQFLRMDLDAWASQRILGLPPKRLADYHQKSTRATRAVLAGEALIPELLQPAAVSSALPSKTKKSVIRDLVALAERTGHVLDAPGLLASVEAREALCSTALPGGLALLHCRNHQPYRFDASFLVVARTIQEIHFGAPDGRPTWLFFLLCCQDERLHLHALARLCLIVQKTHVVEEVLAAPDAGTIHTLLVQAEETALAGKKTLAAPANE